MKRYRRIIIISLLILSTFYKVDAQERLAPLQQIAVPERNMAPKAASSVQLPFFDDFSDYGGWPRRDLWEASPVLVSRGYASMPPSIGMATLDVLNAEGELYTFSTGRFAADTLTSVAIRLDSAFSPTKKALAPSDSVMLSFFYLPGGGEQALWERIGECPNSEDSLLVEFWNPANDAWEQVWATGGESVDSLVAHTHQHWQYVCIPITNRDYFSSEFRFRFRNYGTLTLLTETGIAGNTDQWHIDYVTLDQNRRRNISTARDITFVEAAPSMLEKYQAMPARQFNSDEMASMLEMTIANRYSQALASHYYYTVYDESHQEIANYDGGYENIPPFLPNETYQTYTPHAVPPVNFVFPVSGTPRTFEVAHIVKEGASNDEHPCNDTVRFIQVFDNYYAYDDGEPENGYGLSSTSSTISVACRFELNVADTLTAIDLYFNHTRDNENVGIPFNLTIWEDNEGKPGRVVYSDPTTRYADFEGLNHYVRYLLETPQVVNGTIYVGFVQHSGDYINMGFDRNNDARDNIYYNIGSMWQKTVYKGALMLRPYFGAKATIGIHPTAEMDVAIYPNPAKDFIHISVAHPEQTRMELYNLLGQRILSQEQVSDITVSSLPAGTYILHLYGPSNRSGRDHTMKKIVVLK